MDPDMNKYDLEQVVTAPRRMSKEEWEGIYAPPGTSITRPNTCRRSCAAPPPTTSACRICTGMLFMFSKSVAIEKVHPLQGGMFRRKYRLDRRYGMPIEPVWAFYPKYCLGDRLEARADGVAMVQDRTHASRASATTQRHSYTDAALTPVADDETETLEMFTHNEGARNEVVRMRKIDDLTHGTGQTLADA